jgi:glycosyltransferase 2 family protein
LTDWLSDNRRYLLRFLGTLVAVGLIFILVREGEWTDVLAALRQISWVRILLGLALILLSRLFVATRWYLLLRSGKVQISFSDAAALTFTGLFASNFLPTTIGGDVIRLAGAMQMGFDRAVCLASIAADRVIGMVAMLFTLPFGLIPAWYGLGHAGIQSATFAALFARWQDFSKRIFQAFSIWLKQPLPLLAALACAWGHMLCTFFALYILIDGLGWHVGFWLIAGLWSLAYFVTLVPISINGYGVQELSLTFLFSTIGGLSSAAGLTVAVLIRVLYLAASLPGAIYMPIILGAMDVDRTDQGLS